MTIEQIIMEYLFEILMVIALALSEVIRRKALASHEKDKAEQKRLSDEQKRKSDETNNHHAREIQELKTQHMQAESASFHIKQLIEIVGANGTRTNDEIKLSSERHLEASRIHQENHKLTIDAIDDLKKLIGSQFDQNRALTTSVQDMDGKLDSTTKIAETAIQGGRKDAVTNSRMIEDIAKKFEQMLQAINRKDLSASKDSSERDKFEKAIRGDLEYIKGKLEILTTPPTENLLTGSDTNTETTNTHITEETKP